MSKFQPLAYYQAKPSQYKLLPFRFERIGDEEVVMTNAAGEFVYLNRTKLDALIGHRLTPEDTDYTALRAKHFICEQSDQASVELLALKTRTRYQHLQILLTCIFLS